VIINRRELVVRTTALALAGTALSGLMAPAAAQSPSPADLAKAGPLGDQVQGKDDAPVTIIEYASMTCSHCATFHNETYPTLKSKYIDTGKVRYILREFPLDPLATGAFMLARCAGEGKYYPLVEALFQKQKDWVVQKPIEPLMAIAKQAGFTQETFEKCLSNQQMMDGIEAVRLHGAEKLGVNSTPTFFINGKIHRGTMTVQELEKQLAAYLKS
jgi:protein-disulfide isomerase